MRPYDVFSAQMMHSDKMSKSRIKTYERYKHRHCVAFYFLTFDRSRGFMIIKTKRIGFLGFIRYTNRSFDGGRDYTLYPKPISEIFKETASRMCATKFEDEILKKELYEWRVLHSI